MLTCDKKLQVGTLITIKKEPRKCRKTYKWMKRKEKEINEDFNLAIAILLLLYLQMSPH